MKELHRPKDSKISETAELVELGKAARVVFHDLSNHLTALTLSVGHIEAGLARDTKRLREYSKRSAKTRAQMEYVASLLRSHIEKTNDSTFRPIDEINSVIGSFTEKFKIQKIGIHLKYQKDLRLFGSRAAFGHVVTNLVSNAIDAIVSTSDKRPRKITLTLKADRANIILSVADTGCGISKDHLDKIFNPAFTTKADGHGIGLFATKDFVEKKFNGTIEIVDSNDRYGTQFLVRIPMIPKNTQNRRRLSTPVFQNDIHPKQHIQTTGTKP